MRKLVLYELVSIDGVAEEPGNWMFDVGAATMDNLCRVIERQDTILLGRGTYDYWVGYWPTSDQQPFADFINSTPKHVFTSSTPEQDWARAEFVAGPAAGHVAALKETDGGDIGVHGSIALCQSLLRAGLVDELRLVVAPALAGRGRRLFDVDGELQRFQLVDAAGTPEGAVLLGYELRR
jgi:dihydrofolate reductase